MSTMNLSVTRYCGDSYNDSITQLLKINNARHEFNRKISRLNRLRKENEENRNEYYINKIARNREIKALEKELFTGWKV